MFDIVVIGGGASGMAAAIEAAERGCRVCIAEKMDRVGKKLLATGNGRCNLSNRDLGRCHFHGSVAALLPQMSAAADGKTVEAFWRHIGIDYIELEKGKLYPRSLQASAALNALRRRLAQLNVTIKTETTISEIRKAKGGFSLKAGADMLSAQAVILCAGGRAYPKLGAAGEGARLAETLNMKVQNLRPALCRLNLDFPYLKRLAGIKISVPAALYENNRKLGDDAGDVLFTATGVSGPPILNLSRQAGEVLARRGTPQLVLDLVPEMEKEALTRYLRQRFRRLEGWTLAEALEGFLPMKVAEVTLLLAGLNAKQSAAVSEDELQRLAAVMKAWTAPVSGLAGWQEAQITVGGVHVSEVTERLESRRCRGLFLAGEVLDIDGDCGGYNLQWAVGSGVWAARGAAEWIKVKHVKRNNSK